MLKTAIATILAIVAVANCQPPRATYIECGSGLRCPINTVCGGGPYAICGPGACCPVSGSP
jgi:hypothetical protein